MSTSVGPMAGTGTSASVNPASGRSLTKAFIVEFITAVDIVPTAVSYLEPIESKEAKKDWRKRAPRRPDLGEEGVKRTTVRDPPPRRRVRATSGSFPRSRIRLGRGCT